MLQSSGDQDWYTVELLLPYELFKLDYVIMASSGAVDNNRGKVMGGEEAR